MADCQHGLTRGDGDRGLEIKRLQGLDFRGFHCIFCVFLDNNRLLKHQRTRHPCIDRWFSIAFLYGAFTMTPSLPLTSSVVRPSYSIRRKRYGARDYYLESLDCM